MARVVCGAEAVSSTATTSPQVVHYGPIWMPRPKLDESFALCRTDGGQTLTKTREWVTCPTCLNILSNRIIT